MFDFAWSEIVLIGAVALIAIGPKDMPAAIRTVTGMIKKARRMAAEFQTHVDEMVREADLGDVKKAFNDIRNMDITAALEKHDRSGPVDPQDLRGQSVRPTSDLIRAATEVSTLDQVTVDGASGGRGHAGARRSPGRRPRRLPPNRNSPLAPAFIPPQLVPTAAQASPPPTARFHSTSEAVLQFPRSERLRNVSPEPNAPQRSPDSTWQTQKTIRSTTSRCRCSII